MWLVEMLMPSRDSGPISWGLLELERDAQRLWLNLFRGVFSSIWLKQTLFCIYLVSRLMLYTQHVKPEYFLSQKLNSQTSEEPFLKKCMWIHWLSLRDRIVFSTNSAGTICCSHMQNNGSLPHTTPKLFKVDLSIKVWTMRFPVESRPWIRQWFLRIPK